MDFSNYRFISVSVPSRESQPNYHFGEEVASVVFVVKFATKEQSRLKSFYRVVFETGATDTHMAVVTFDEIVDETARHLDGSIILDFPEICKIWCDAEEKFGSISTDDEETMSKLHTFLKSNYQKAIVTL